MCGIAGFVVTEPNTGSRGVVERMTGAIAHRGPDADGFFHDEHAFLGHRRLAIVDVATGAQPMFNEDGSLVIIYNGEIFNHALVRPELEQAGHQFVSDHSDTETLIHGYEQWGPRELDRFRGMFAFVLWDRKAKRLFAARDRLGIKPFYYFWNGKLFAFASEIKALLEHPAISAEFEESVVAEYLAFGYVSEERTMFRNIKKLMPGHHLTLDVDSRSIHIEQFWDVPEATNSEKHSDQDWIAETRRRLEETVQLRLMSDVPLGMFLSGGVDSSAIAALIRKMVPGPVKTFSVGYAEEQYSELGYAAEVARAIGTDHHEVRVSMEDFFNTLPRLIWHEDEPITWPSSVSLHFVSKLAAEQVKVVLTGEGSDELFAGYERYRWNLMNQKALGVYQAVPGGLRRQVRSFLSTTSLLRANVRRKVAHTFIGRDERLESLYLDNFYSAFSNGPDSAYANYMGYWNSRPDADLLPRMLYADQKTYLVELLMKQDQMSMSCSIESRVPFLDHEFVEFSTRIPQHLKIHGGIQKYVFKKAVEDLLPNEIVHRKKMGFPTPIRKWLMSPQAQPLFAALEDPNGFVAQYVSLSELKPLIARHLSN
ncbi:MAG TPA: asparagine synthase (glutamine-hydrolyzing), partial [Bryobacteraceae bacterium]